MGLLSWLSCHNAAFERLAGILTVNRIDNVRTAPASGAGPWGTIHPAYRSYARTVGFHTNACLPRDPETKGKAEAAVRLSRLRVDPGPRRFVQLRELQRWIDERLEAWSKRAICPATGKTADECSQVNSRVSC